MHSSQDLSIYVHIPFCARKCLYCDFLSFTAEKDLINRYFDALSKEICLYADTYKDYTVKSVFFGGGTPSLPDTEYICDILDQLHSKFKFSEDVEITIEMNPGTASFDKLIKYKAAGINRLSIGAQSFNDDELKKLGRIHDFSTFIKTYEDAVEAGFENINIDLMSALPGQSLETYLSTLKKAVELKPTHISAYSLIVEEGTPFFDMELDLPDEDTDRLMYHETKRILAESGYHRYEISNYALGDGEKNECYHNKVYWERGNYLGLGLGASSMIENVRFSNITDIMEYIGRLSASESVVSEKEELSLESQMEEFMFLGLRLVKGVDMDLFYRQFGKKAEDVYGDVIVKYKTLGLIETDGNRLRLTEKGLDVSNTVMAEFCF
ncbi:radical SAM family heme chaperone HemW [Butyrivibrio sp. INlla21]|uniref:radical SAM family heme chaperone HemW n=1 Tax=Butyrivibrio sp. INlla21 TaxID=1520811 RepID=UPI0008E55076|nr:radical SAM family heme chaperone HemW [Butyrivibrio sp. INlla21]SFU31108.1 oxygen-independent coproporphyrinogen-3 oxidase [Butyrivibrio sp. INlla21]